MSSPLGQPRQIDGFLGWPKPEAAGTLVDGLDDYNTDSMLGEAMALWAVVWIFGEIRKSPASKEKYGARAESCVQLVEQTYTK